MPISVPGRTRTNFVCLKYFQTLAREKIAKKIGNFQILAVIASDQLAFNQNFADWHIRLYWLRWLTWVTIFAVVILSRHVLRKMTILPDMLCQNLETTEAALRRLWRLAEFWPSAKNGEFLKLGIELISRSLVADLSLTQTKLALVRS